MVQISGYGEHHFATLWPTASLGFQILTKEILPITLRIGDGNAQPNEQPEEELGKAGTGAAVVWKKNRNSEEWQEPKTSLGQNKEIFDAEMWASPKLLRLQNKKPERYSNHWSLVYYVALRQSSTT